MVCDDLNHGADVHPARFERGQKLGMASDLDHQQRKDIPDLLMGLQISVDDGEKIELPVIVVSSGIKGSESATGVGCKFGRLDATQQAIVDEMFATALDTE